jgi:hypothetical protein
MGKRNLGRRSRNGKIRTFALTVVCECPAQPASWSRDPVRDPGRDVVHDLPVRVRGYCADHLCEVRGRGHLLHGDGVVFEEYDLPGLKTVDGVAEHASGARGAWFKDPDGNILQIGQYRS